MGVMRFLVPGRQRIATDADQRGYLTGFDEVPWQTRLQWESDVLVARRMEAESGTFVVPWHVPGFGELMLSTATLIERDAPYHLPVELARGTINRVRNQLAAWQAAGLSVGETTSAGLAEASALLAKAVTSQHEPLAAQELAEQALQISLDVMNQLSMAYTDHVLSLSQAQSNQRLSVLGVNLGSTLLKEQVQNAIVTTFNAATVPLVWREIEASEGQLEWDLCDRQIEWCRANGLKVCGGPLLELDRWSLPDWLYLWEGDQENLIGFVTEHIRSVVERYRGRVHVWNCASRLNVNSTLSLAEEERLRLAALAVETVRSADARTPVVVCMDQPWGEFMGRQETELSPIYFADMLVRGDLGLSGLGLELNIGYCPDGTASRDVLEFGRQLDRWGSLGLPLLVSLVVPSSHEADPRARVKDAVPCSTQEVITPQWQRDWIEQFMPVLLAKPAVQGIIWNQLLDSKPHDYPHGGIFDVQDEPKPALTAIHELRAKYL